MPVARELGPLAAAKLHLDWCINNKLQVMALGTADGTLKIMDSEQKLVGLMLLSL